MVLQSLHINAQELADDVIHAKRIDADVGDDVDAHDDAGAGAVYELVPMFVDSGVAPVAVQ